MSNGLLISFEGLEGAGKTTQIDLLCSWLDFHKISYIRTREPGGTALGDELRPLLLSRPELDIDPLAEAFLFSADRAQHFTKKILPALCKGKLVITDRCIDSYTAFQGYARGVSVELVDQLLLLSIQ